MTIETEIFSWAGSGQSSLAGGLLISHCGVHAHCPSVSAPSAASAPLPPRPLGRSAARPLCRSAEPSRPCRFCHSRQGRSRGGSAAPGALPLLLLLPLPPEGRFCQGAPLLPLPCLALRLQGTEGMAHYMDDEQIRQLERILGDLEATQVDSLSL